MRTRQVFAVLTFVTALSLLTLTPAAMAEPPAIVAAAPTATPALDVSDLETLAAREAAAPQLQEFRAGDSDYAATVAWAAMAVGGLALALGIIAL